MASFKKNLVLSSVIAVVAALSACGKPEIRSKTMDTPTSPTAPSTASNPKVAETENKANDAALKLQAKTDPEAATAAETAAARKKAALDELSELMNREGVDQKEIEDAKAKVAEAGGTIPGDATVATATGTAGDKTDVKTTNGSNVTLLDDAAKTKLVEQAAHRAFAIAMIEPVMRANFQVFLARNEVLRLKAIVEVDKKELTADQTTWLKKLRLEYGLAEDNKDFALLLERVDGVNLTFLVAPLALRSNWAIDTEVQADKIVKRVQEMNISPSDDKVRFRSARLAVKTPAQEESLSIMKAFLGYNDSSKTQLMENLLANVSEIVKLTGEPAFATEVERVRALLIEDYKTNAAAKTVPVEAAKK